MAKSAWMTTLLIAVFATPAAACSEPYRSLDWHIAHSALIVTGTVTGIEEIAGVAPPWETQEKKPILVAIVRVDRVIHGKCNSTTIRVRSGPVHS